MYVEPTPKEASKMIREVKDQGKEQGIVGDYEIIKNQTYKGVEFWSVCSVELDEDGLQECTWWGKPLAGLKDEL